MTSLALMSIKLSESDKRILIALFLLILLIIIIFGYLQKLVAYIMRNQGLQVDGMMYDIVRSGVIASKRKFKKEAYRRSEILFLKRAWIPFTAMLLLAGATVLYAYIINDMGFGFFKKSLYDISFGFSPAPTTYFFGLTIYSDWPQIVKVPDFSWNIDKYFSMLMVVAFSIFALIFLVDCQALMACFMRIRKLGRTYFSKDINKLSGDKI